MKVMQIVETPNGLTLQPSERPVPKPGQGELLLRVRAAGVITAELEWQPTTHKPDGSPRKHAIPAHELPAMFAPAVTESKTSQSERPFTA